MNKEPGPVALAMTQSIINLTGGAASPSQQWRRFPAGGRCAPTAGSASWRWLPNKLDYVEHLLHEHRKDRAIVFTQDNATAYRISTRLLIPAITHQTKVSERSEIFPVFHDLFQRRETAQEKAAP